MIFITLGTQKFQLNRLLQEIDQLIDKNQIKETVVAQIGYSDYKPSNFRTAKFMNSKEYTDNISSADLVISHGGTGAIVSSLKRSKKTIAVPRRYDFGEHVDNHQFEIVSEFEKMNFLVACYDCGDLLDCINAVKNKKIANYKSDTNSILEDLERNIVSLFKDSVKGSHQ